jgi:uncharacterized Zn-binding protein involved in type VI secretion
VPRTLAKEDDDVVAIDTHFVMVATPSGPTPTPQPSPFRGPLAADLSRTVLVDGKAAATVGSAAHNRSAHVPQGGTFQREPANRATVEQGSPTVFIDGRAAARHGDAAKTCNDPSDLAIGKVVSNSSVVIEAE